jgi:hypothetical protein
MAAERVTAGQMCAGLTQLILWLKDVLDLVCQADPGTVVAYTAGSGGSSNPPTGPAIPVLHTVNCPPPETDTSSAGSTSTTVTNADLCATFERMIAWAEELRDYVCALDPDAAIAPPPIEKASFRSKGAPYRRRRRA